MLPPELMGQLGGEAGGLPQGLAPQGLPASGPPAPPEEEEASPLEHLRAAIEHAQAALVGEPDDQDSQALSKVISGLYAILATRQKEEQQLLGGSNMRALARSQSGM